ncbi:SseB family protein [Sinomonas sp. P10A9]|uniref:SseB family protein n=1 Tax=Sinomonas puerhi TaxID=3238584 RepID=A0AB39L1K1_9MICC
MSSDHVSASSSGDHAAASGEGVRAANGAVPLHLDPAPLTELEESLAAASESGTEDDGQQSILVFLNSLVCLLVPEPVPGETHYVEPLVLNNGEGKPVVAAFTHRQRIRPDFLDHAPTIVETQGAMLLQNLGTELGLVLNPGSAYGFELSTEHIAAVLRDFRPADSGELAPEETVPAEHPDLQSGQAGE